MPSVLFSGDMKKESVEKMHIRQAERREKQKKRKITISKRMRHVGTYFIQKPYK